MADTSDGAPRLVAWFLAVSYGIGAPLVAVLEIAASTLSERFGVPAWLILATAVVQLVCVPLVFSGRHAPRAAVVLSAITVGAAISHIRIGSPSTAVPALLYTGIQVWFGIRASRAEA